MIFNSKKNSTRSSLKINGPITGKLWRTRIRQFSSGPASHAKRSTKDADRRRTRRGNVTHDKSYAPPDVTSTRLIALPIKPCGEDKVAHEIVTCYWHTRYQDNPPGNLAALATQINTIYSLFTFNLPYAARRSSLSAKFYHSNTKLTGQVKFTHFRIFIREILERSNCFCERFLKNLWVFGRLKFCVLFYLFYCFFCSFLLYFVVRSAILRLTRRPPWWLSMTEW